MEMKSLKSRRKGLATVEMAIVLPLLLMLVLGVIHYGWLFLKMQQITNAARSGARVAIRANVTDPAEVQAAVTSALANAGIGAVVVPVITPGIDIGTGEELTVKLTVPKTTPGISLINATFLPTPANLVASVTMAKEGP